MTPFFKSCSLLMLIVWPLISCGGSSDKHPDTSPIVSKEPPRVTKSMASLNLHSRSDDTRILGQWTTSCILNTENNSSSRWTMTIDNSGLVQDTAIFQDRNCVTPIFSIRVATEYYVYEGEMRTTTRFFSATFQSQTYADAASRSSSCGFNTWRTGVEYNVIDLKCPAHREGLTVTGNQSGLEQRFPYSFSTQSSQAVLDLDGFVLKRALRDNDSEVFNDTASMDNVKLLKSKGCDVGLTFGVRHCKQVTTLEEAAELYTELRTFAWSIANDPRTRPDSIMRKNMNDGYLDQLSLVENFGPYKAATQEFDRSVMAFMQTSTIKAVVMRNFEIDAVTAMKGLKALQEVAQNPTFESEFKRLMVTHIYLSKTFKYGAIDADKKSYGLFWDSEDTAVNLWNKILNTK